MGGYEGGLAASQQTQLSMRSQQPNVIPVRHHSSYTLGQIHPLPCTKQHEVVCRYNVHGHQWIQSLQTSAELMCMI